METFPLLCNGSDQASCTVAFQAVDWSVLAPTLIEAVLLGFLIGAVLNGMIWGIRIVLSFLSGR